MIWEMMAKKQLLEIELERLDILLNMVGKGTFKWNREICPVCIKAREFVDDTGFTALTRCAICSSMGISARCVSIDSAYCDRKDENDQLNDKDIEFFVHLFAKYIINVKEELAKLKK